MAPEQIPIRAPLMPPPLKKSLGQHFLSRPEVCAPLVSFLDAAGDDRVVEIGPGGGALTSALLASGAAVTAWEIDPFWAAEVARRWRDQRLTVVVGDATELVWERLPHRLVAGNLPYNVATRIVLACLESTLTSPGYIERVGFLVQLEVAERLVAGPGDSAYGSLSVLVQALARVELLGRVSPRAFRPPPRVESAFIGLTPRALLDRAEYDGLKLFVRSAFAHRRKTLRNSLAADVGVGTATRLLDLCGLPGDTRAERLDIESFRRLHRRLRVLQREDQNEGSD